MYKGLGGAAIDGNIIRVGSSWIYMNPDRDAAKHIFDHLSPHGRIHIFYSSPKAADDIGDLMRNIDIQIANDRDALNRYKAFPLKLYAHHGKDNHDMGVMLRCLIPDTLTVKCRVIPESKDVRFIIPGKSIIHVKLNHHREGVGNLWRKIHQELIISISGHDVSVETDVRICDEMYRANFISCFTGNNVGAITSEEQRMHPEFFRDGILRRFKENTLPEILKSFHGDDDIWDYITCQGEWKVEA